MRARRLAILVLAVTLAGCGRGEGQPQWGDAADSAWLPVLDPVTVVEGDVWRFDVGPRPSYGAGGPGASCLQAVVAAQPLGCTEVGSFFQAVTRAGDERVIWRADTISSARQPTDHFVVWSNVSPEGRRLDPIVHDRIENLLWIMAPGEAPWGHQAIAADGTLISHWSYVGLPAD
jgi:hypothetical protein